MIPDVNKKVFTLTPLSPGMENMKKDVSPIISNLKGIRGRNDRYT
jgi:hypothetical protein